MSLGNWAPKALDQLADIYVALPAERRVELERAVAEVEEHVLSSSQFSGESRTKYGRVYIHPMLIVFFTVVPLTPVRIVGVRPNRPLRPRPKA